MEESKDWMEQAEADLVTAENSLLSKDYYASAFWSQQAVEKCLKAVIIKNSKVLVKVHDLIFLGKKANISEELFSKLRLLSGIYIESRYGITASQIPAKKFKENDASEFLKISKEVLAWCKKKI
jgi:HEPN domain-containing protein